MKASEVIEALEHERERLVNAVDALGDDALTLPVTQEGWTAKDVLAHLVHWAGQVAFALGAALSPPAYVLEERSRMPTGDEWNALAVAYYGNRSLSDVRGELDRIADLINERVRLRNNEEVNATDAVPWAPSRPLWQFIGGETFLHWPIHAEAIERAAQGRN